MEEKRYKEKERVFESVKIPLTFFKNGPLGIKPPEEGDNSGGPKGIIYNNDNITLVIPFINAVDIDWNKANVGEDKQLETTADLLNWILNSATDLRTTMFNLAKSGDLVLAENGFIKNLWSLNINTDYLTVNKAAHFFELIIDKINSVLGTQINTAANCIADFIKTYNEYDEEDSINIKYFRVYWRSSDSDGNSTDNCWLINDLAYCLTFNAKTTNNNAGNTYYWRLVINTSNDVTDKTFINFDKGEIKTLTNNLDLEEISDALSFQIKFSNLDTVNFNVTNTLNEWEGNTWIPVDILSLLTLEPIEEIGNCLFSFNTDIKTKLDIKVQYVDGSLTYTKANEYKTEYSIPLENKFVQKIIITTLVIDLWQPCHWIDLSNVTGDDDAREVDYNSTIPSVGDNICQLGYRYTNLDGYANTAEWKQNNLDKISRASAIIIAAYATPDSGIVPPSYAQYQNITNFENLASHRKTYFDAIGAKFVGDFEVVSNLGEESLSVIEYLDSLRYDNPLLITSNIDSIFLRTDDNNQIDITEDGLNNFPSVITTSIFYENVQVSPTSLSVELNLTGTSKNYTVDLTNNTVSADSNTDKIYLNTVSLTDNNYLLGFSCSEQTGTQTINNGSQVIIRATYEDSTLNKTFYALKVIPITGINVTAGSNGQNAEIWKLYKVKEYAVVSAAEDISVSLLGMLLRPGLTVNLQYKIQHVSGTTYDYNNDSEYIIKVRQYTPSGIYIPGSEATLPKENGIYTYLYNDNDWYSSRANNNYNKCNYLIVNLINNTTNEIVDSSIVSVILKPTSLFKVKEGLTQSILAISTRVGNGSISNYSSITQAVNSINSQVGTISNDVGTLQGNVGTLQSDVSDITQTANLIDATVSNAVAFERGNFPLDSSIEEYVFIRTLSEEKPSVPTIIEDTNVDAEWTKSRIETTATYPYLWYSIRTKENENSNWSNWSSPKLIQVWDETLSQPGSLGYASAANLTITANKIESTVQNTTEKTTGVITATGAALQSFINGLLAAGIDVTSENGGEVNLIANKTNFVKPKGNNGTQKMISVEMCNSEGVVDHESGTIPSIVFYNEYGTPQWILNYLVGMQKVFISTTLSWDTYTFIKFSNLNLLVVGLGMNENTTLYPEAFFPEVDYYDPEGNGLYTEGYSLYYENTYKFNAAYGEDPLGNRIYMPSTAEGFNGSFWKNNEVIEELDANNVVGNIPNTNTNINSKLTGYYIIRELDDNDSFILKNLETGVNSISSIEFGNIQLPSLEDQINSAISAGNISHNTNIVSNADYHSGIILTGGDTYKSGTLPVLDGDIWTTIEHYDNYILLYFGKNNSDYLGYVYNKLKFTIYYKTFVNQNRTKLKYVLTESDGEGGYIRPSKIIIPIGENSIESAFITILGIINLMNL